MALTIGSGGSFSIAGGSLVINSGGGGGGTPAPAIFDGIVAPPSVSSLSWFNKQGADTATDGTGIINISIPSGQSAGVNASRRVLGVAIPATPYTLDIGFTWAPSSSSYPIFGMAAYEQSTGKVLDWNLYWTGSAFHTQFSRILENGNAGFAYSDSQISNSMSPTTCFLRMVDNGTNISVYWSNDNTNWTQFDTARSRTDYMAGGPSHIGICMDAFSANASLTARVFHWKLH